jgi:hypothetical protein
MAGLRRRLAAAFEQVAQIGHVPLERPPSGPRQRHPCSRLLTDEVLLDRDVAGLLQRSKMCRHVAVRGAEDRFQPAEFQALAGEFSLYAHLKPNSLKVKAGQKVEQGAVIGAVGSSGNSTEPHLHFQVCNSSDPLMCAGIPPAWRGLAFTFDDFPRAPQSGDLIYDLKTPE